VAGRHRTVVAVAAATMLAIGSAVAGSAGAAPGHPSIQSPAAVGANIGFRLHSGHGIHIQQVVRVGHRQFQVRIVPHDLKRAIGVRIILPVGYRAGSEQRYPSLYLFPGTSGHSYDWATVGHAVKTTKPYGLITVDSDIGIDGDGGSWFTNWVDTKTKLGPSQWESYDIHELIPWIDANLKTIPFRGERAIAGLSMGGYGAMELAARHPDLFTMASSFSGAPEIDRNVAARVGATAIISATMVGLNGVPANAPFGSHDKNEINWQGHDPARLVENLRGLRLWLATGDGEAGVYDDPVTDPGGYAGGSSIESLAHTSSQLFHRILVQQNIPSTYRDYGAGTHSWPYWARDLRWVMPSLMNRLAHPPGQRQHVHYTSIQASWNVFGWHARFHRAKRLAFSNLTHATRHGFRLFGSGRAVIRTPRFYPPRTAYRVKLPGRPHSKSLMTNGRGQLRISVSLGVAKHRVHVGIE
jgi:S-formylglutathione hydrolase FrmB